MVERRQAPSDSESLDLLVHNSTIMFEQVLSLGTRLGELNGCISSLRDSSEQALALSKEAAKHGAETAEHSAETRRLIESHLRESEAWKIVITKLEADLASREYWRRTGRILQFGITRLFMLFAFFVGLFLSVHSAIPHIKDFFRGQ